VTVTTAASDRLADIRKRKGDIRDAIAAAKRDRDRTRQAAIDSGNLTDPTSGEFKAAERAMNVLANLEGQLDLVHEEERFVLAQVAGLSPDFGGDSFLSDHETLRDLSRLATSSQPIGKVDLGLGVPRGDLLQMMRPQAALTPGQVDVGEEARRGRYVGIQPILRRRLRLLDLIPSMPLDAGNSVEYNVETAAASGIDDAGETAEGAVKPATALDYPDAEAKVKTIPVFTKLRRQQLADVPTLEQTVRARLAHMVLRRLERQILSGNGTGENLRGIYNTSGVGGVAFSATELDADQVLEGEVDVILSEAEPNGVAVHPRNWADMRKEKNTGGDGNYWSGGPFAPTSSTLWETPAVIATGAVVNRPLVGDYEIGATVFVREGVTLRMSDSDQDDFVRNRVTLLAEGRFALAVWYPGAFSIVELV
jgi:hypothetical protein